MGKTSGELDKLEEEVALEFENAVGFARRSSLPEKTELLNHVFFSTTKGA